MRQSRMAVFGRKFLAVAAGTGLAIGVAACGSSASSGSTAAAASGPCSNIPAGPIKIANILPLSGPTAQSGEGSEVSIGLSVAYFNAHDSVCGHKFALSNYNDKGDPATSLGIARQLVSQGNPIIVEDSFGSAQSQIQPYLMQNHVLVVNGQGAYSLFNAKQNPTAYSTGPSTATYAQVMVNWAKSHNDNNLGILSDGTPFSVELAADVQSDAEAAGLKFIKTITYSPTEVDLATPVTQAKQAGIETLMPTGFSGITAMMSAIKTIGWSPTVISYGILGDFGVTASQVPPGTVDGCNVWYTEGEPTSTLLTPTNTALLKAEQAKIGLNPETSTILFGYFYLLAIKHAIVTANSLDGTKTAAALSATSNLTTNVPDVNLDWTLTPSVHNAISPDSFKMCTLKRGPYDIPYAGS